MQECALSRRILHQNNASWTASRGSCTRLRKRNPPVKHQRGAWPASRMANKRRSRSGVSFGRTGTHVAAFHGKLNSRARSLECVVHPPQADTWPLFGPIRQPC
jgi:hypothetical protein